MKSGRREAGVFLGFLLGVANGADDPFIAQLVHGIESLLVLDVILRRYGSLLEPELEAIGQYAILYVSLERKRDGW